MPRSGRRGPSEAGALLGGVDVATSAVASVTPAGRLDIDLCRLDAPWQRARLARTGRGPLFGTRFDHRRDAHVRAVPRLGDADCVLGLRPRMARCAARRWISVPGITALAFHGARRG